jgi:hypothetical protein
VIPLYLNGIGLLAPGLVGWQDSLSVLSGRAAYQPVPLPALSPTLLPANERRRTTALIRLALQAASEAVANANATASDGWPLFASSGGDMAIIDCLCRALWTPERAVSPTDFHNSVHNAPAGYWAIATGCQHPSLSLSAYDASFSAGLLEAWSICASEAVDVLLVAYDYPAPDPLAGKRPLIASFAVALRLSRQRGPHCLARLHAALSDSADPDRLGDPALEQLRQGNPAARSLPLLQRLAAGDCGRVSLPYLEPHSLTLWIEP